MLKITEVAEIFSVSRQTILAWIKKGKIKAVKIDRLYLIEASEIKRIKGE